MRIVYEAYALFLMRERIGATYTLIHAKSVVRVLADELRFDQAGTRLTVDRIVA
jgi:hypothetical protein